MADEANKDNLIENDTKYPKERKEIVEYRPGEPGMDCVSCTHYQDPEACAKVVGQIYRSGTCNLFETEGANDPEKLSGLEQEDLEKYLFGGE